MGGARPAWRVGKVPFHADYLAGLLQLNPTDGSLAASDLD